jgi:hypothetical protein
MSQQDYSNHLSYQIQKLAESTAICEALAGERFNWGNGTENHLAHLQRITNKLVIDKILAQSEV